MISEICRRTFRRKTTVKRLLTFACLAMFLSAVYTLDLKAQDLVITNARILDGNGGEITSGNVVVRGGRIASVSQGIASGPRGATQIDARGMTVMPGFVDGHRHILGGGPGGGAMEWLDQQGQAEMQEYLDAGYTTMLSAGDDLEGILELRRRLADEEMVGPRLVVAGRASTTDTPEEARAAVRMVTEAGVDVIKSSYASTEDGSTTETLGAIIDEAGRLGIPTILHVTEVNDMVRSVRMGINQLVHTPHTGVLASIEEGAQLVAEMGVPMTSTLGVWTPRFDNEENESRFRDNSPFPGAGFSRAGQAPVNARLLWDAGVTYGFGTDTRFDPTDGLRHELRPLTLLFSAKDIVQILTKNAAEFVGMADDIGTLEAGKYADIVIIDGDPLDNIYDVLDIEMVIRGGDVVVDNR